MARPCTAPPGVKHPLEGSGIAALHCLQHLRVIDEVAKLLQVVLRLPPMHLRGAPNRVACRSSNVPEELEKGAGTPSPCPRHTLVQKKVRSTRGMRLQDKGVPWTRGVPLLYLFYIILV